MKPEEEHSVFRVTGRLVVALLVLFALHQASWLSQDSHLIWALPAGLAYHLGYCLLVSLVLGLFIFRKKS